MKNKTLSDKRIDVPTINQEHAYYYPERNVKQHIQEAERRLKDKFKNEHCAKEYFEEIKKIFKEEFGDLR